MLFYDRNSLLHKWASCDLWSGVRIKRVWAPKIQFTLSLRPLRCGLLDSQGHAFTPYAPIVRLLNKQTPPRFLNFVWKKDLIPEGVPRVHSRTITEHLNFVTTEIFPNSRLVRVSYCARWLFGPLSNESIHFRRASLSGSTSIVGWGSILFAANLNFIMSRTVVGLTSSVCSFTPFDLTGSANPVRTVIRSDNSPVSVSSSIGLTFYASDASASYVLNFTGRRLKKWYAIEEVQTRKLHELLYQNVGNVLCVS